MEDLQQAIKEITELRNIQGEQVMDDYMLGLYNGLECALATLERRTPDFKEKR